MTPFRAPSLLSCDPETAGKRREYNRTISGCRIRAEMTFGFMLNKWRIFHRPLAMHLPNVERIILCAFRLHNFVINYAIENKGRQSGRRWVEMNSTCTEYQRIADSGENPGEETLSDCRDGAQLRQRLVDIIAQSM
eukprot:GHVU01153128.1.p2 GENE.GHVU01153128.1~~GHVU01153128.1.p2  ORF type:complete len:136 (-),score=3.57 GHVU01153128.1:641-1048(-)